MKEDISPKFSLVIQEVFPNFFHVYMFESILFWGCYDISGSLHAKFNNLAAVPRNDA